MTRIETLEKQRKTICFRGINHAVNTSKMACFPAVHRCAKLSDNGTKTRVHRLENKLKISHLTIGKRKRMSAKCRFFAMLTDRFLSGWTLLFWPCIFLTNRLNLPSKSRNWVAKCGNINAIKKRKKEVYAKPNSKWPLLLQLSKYVSISTKVIADQASKGYFVVIS